MFKLIQGLPPFAVGIVASDEVTADDYSTVLEPALKQISGKWKGINILFNLDTNLSNFSAGAWAHDLKVNTKYFLKWNKMAFVTEDPTLEKLANGFKHIIAGEVKVFPLSAYQEAKSWIAVP